jgi:membrane protein
MSDHAAQPTHDPAASRVRRRVDAAKGRYRGSWLEDLMEQLKVLDFFDRTTVIGAELLWSALPFLIILSSLANDRIDDDISRHIGLDSQGAHIVRGLFRNHPTHAIEPIVSGLIFTFAGIVAVVASIQVAYERLYGHEHRGWRDLPRYVAWVGLLLGLLVIEGIVNSPLRAAGGKVLEDVLMFVMATLFFAWTIRFLLHGKVAWGDVMPPALATAVLWVVLAVFSSAYFSSMVVSDSRIYGTIGVVFSFLTWFILIASVIVLGAACGAVWRNRRAAVLD